MNVLSIIWRYKQLKAMKPEERKKVVPRVVMFGGKAASGAHADRQEQCKQALNGVHGEHLFFCCHWIAVVSCSADKHRQKSHAALAVLLLSKLSRHDVSMILFLATCMSAFALCSL